MTELLYLKDSYLKEFEAKVIDIVDDAVELDRTAFYPESGGQPSDTGTLTCYGKIYHITHVFKDKGRVLHRVKELGLKKGETVKGRIDWERRYLFMRYHTACHVLSTVIHNVTGAEITGNQIGADKTRIDFALKDFDKEAIQDYVAAANKLIASGRKVTVKFLPREEAFKIPALVKLRKMLPPTLKTIRIVGVEGFDEQACGGTHVANTSEIGEIQIVELKNKGKDNRRVYFTLK